MRIKISYDILYTEYIINKKSSLQLSKEFNCSVPTIIRRLKFYKIPTRSISDSLKGNLIGIKNPNYRHGRQVKRFDNCIECGKEVTSGCQSGYCQQCGAKYHTRRRINFKNLTTQKYYCKVCNKEIIYNSKKGFCRDCWSESVKHPLPQCPICKRILTKHEG
jgi:hypothetical protein